MKPNPSAVFFVGNFFLFCERFLICSLGSEGEAVFGLVFFGISSFCELLSLLTYFHTLINCYFSIVKYFKGKRQHCCIIS